MSNPTSPVPSGVPCPYCGRGPARERIYLVLLIIALATIAAVVGGLLTFVNGSSVAASLLYGAGSFTGAFLLALAIFATFRS